MKQPDFGKPGSLFGGSVQGSLFQKSNSLFGKTSNSTGGFGSGNNPFTTNKPSGGSIFGGVSTITGSKAGFFSKQKEEEEEEEVEEKEAPTFVAVSKDPHIKLFSKTIEKFFRRSGSKGSGTISIERADDSQDKKYAFLIFRNGVGNNLFTGQILSGFKCVPV